jgi:protein involved in polysaccharide export with SLBB domain
MFTRRSKVKPLSLAVAFVFFVIQCPTPPAQTTDGQQTRPRSLGRPTEDLLNASKESDREAASPEASAEARRLYKAGEQYGHAGLFAQAAELFQRAVKLKPDYADAYRNLGSAYLNLKQWDRAIQSLEQALTLNPKDKDSRAQLDQARLMIESDLDEGPGAQDSPSATPPASSISATTANEMVLTRVYRVGPGDVLEVHLSGASPVAPAAFTVTPSGLLEYPGLAEPLRVAGLTPEEISARLESVLHPNASTADSTVVSVGVRDYVSHAILVSGLVKDPGTKILRREAIPLYVVVADAQPLPEAANAIVVRKESSEVYTVDLTEAAEMNLLVHPGDVINLQALPPEFFYVGGDVKAPGEKTFHRGLTLTQAIITAGGLAGKSSEARLARDDGKGFLVMTRYKLKDIDSGKLRDPLIQPGDRITIKD